MAIEALAAADSALWVWTPAEDSLRVTGASRPLGLGPLAPACSGAAFAAVAMPQDRALAESLLKPQAEGTEIAVRLRMRDHPTCLWRGVWLEDGLRAAGVVALETTFAGSDRDPLTGLLDRRSFLARVGETLTRTGDYELVVADVDRLRRLNEALGHDRADSLRGPVSQGRHDFANGSREFGLAKLSRQQSFEDCLLNVAHGSWIVGLDHQQARFWDREIAQLVQGRGCPIIIHHDSLQEGRRGTSRPHLGKIPPESRYRFIKLLL